MVNKSTGRKKSKRKKTCNKIHHMTEERRERKRKRKIHLPGMKAKKGQKRTQEEAAAMMVSHMKVIVTVKVLATQRAVQFRHRKQRTARLRSDVRKKAKTKRDKQEGRKNTVR